MKTFKTIEELIEFVSDKENIATLESGEITLKEWVELGKSVEKYKKDQGQSANDKKALRTQAEELTKKVAELNGQLDSVNNELAGLKEVHTGGDKEALQKLNKEKSDLLAKQNAAEFRIRELEKQNAEIPDLQKRIESYKEASNRSRIVAAAKKAAAARKVPQYIIDDRDFERIVADDFTIDEAGNIFSKEDSPQSMENYIAARQKDKPHWMPVSQSGSGGEQMRPMSEGGMISDDLAAVAALFG